MLISSVAKALFYNFPEPLARKLIISELEENEFQQALQEILSQTMVNFTKSETREIVRWSEYKWLDSLKPAPENNLPNISSIFNILADFGEKTLDLTYPFPRVKFEKLLRWRELTYYVTEDLVTVPSLVKKSLADFPEIKPKDFTWPDILDHDNSVINKVLDKGLADCHAHLNASSDVFVLNWISMMNNMRILYDKTRKWDFESFSAKEKYPMENEVLAPFGISTFSYYHMVTGAAICRLYLFSCLHYKSLKDESFQMIRDFLTSDFTSILDFPSELQSLINIVRLDSIKSIYDTSLDYAIQTYGINDPTSPYMIHVGERNLLFDAFEKVFKDRKNNSTFSQILFYYILLKNKVRKELIQTNQLIGFENFQQYQDKKDEFLVDKIWHEINTAYAISSSFGKNYNNHLEGRISPSALDRFGDFQIRNPFIEVKGNDNKEILNSNFSVIVHFIKTNIFKGNGSRSSLSKSFRQHLWKSSNKILEFYRDNKGLVVGIDAAGSELNCRPEVFAPMFRWMKANGIDNNMTFHAGEDFFDITDGLRTIYEVIKFMDFGPGSRIGHGLAMGIDPHLYYARRNRTVIAPKQIILDNLVWMLYFSLETKTDLSQTTRNFIENETYNLLNSIGYDFSDRLDYWRSMLLRGNDMEYLDILGHDFSSRDKTAFPEFIVKENLIRSERSKKLYESYELSEEIFAKGNESYMCKIPESYIDDISKLQRALISILKYKGISVECNPSSNLKIGGFKKYSDLPIFKLSPIESSNERRLTASINTDDRGVFGTSIRNEYSLIAASLFKEKDTHSGEPKYSLNEITSYIEDLAENGKHMKFQP